jgi:hypothetical protein
MTSELIKGEQTEVLEAILEAFVEFLRNPLLKSFCDKLMEFDPETLRKFTRAMHRHCLSKLE